MELITRPNTSVFNNCLVRRVIIIVIIGGMDGRSSDCRTDIVQQQQQQGSSAFVDSTSRVSPRAEPERTIKEIGSASINNNRQLLVLLVIVFLFNLRPSTCDAARRVLRLTDWLDQVDHDLHHRLTRDDAKYAEHVVACLNSLNWIWTWSHSPATSHRLLSVRHPRK